MDCSSVAARIFSYFFSLLPSHSILALSAYSHHLPYFLSIWYSLDCFLIFRVVFLCSPQLCLFSQPKFIFIFSGSPSPPLSVSNGFLFYYNYFLFLTIPFPFSSLFPCPCIANPPYPLARMYSFIPAHHCLVQHASPCSWTCDRHTT